MITRITTLSLLVLSIVGLTACSSPPAQVSETNASEQTVLALGEALNAGDVDAAMGLMADDAVFKMDLYEETLVGADEIRGLFEELIAGHFRIALTVQSVDGDQITTETQTWGDGVPGDGPNVATEIYAVDNGKITSISWTPTAETVAKLQAAQDSMPSSVVSVFEKALNEGDLKTAIDLFGSDAQVTFVPDEPYVGKEEIYAWLEQLFAYHFEIEYEFLEESENVLKAQTTSWSDFSRQLNVAPLKAIEIYTVEDGQIKDLEVTLTGESENKLQAAISLLPSSVVMVFTETINSNDLDAIMSLYADNLYFEFTPILLPEFPHPFGGKEEVLTWWKELLASNLQQVAEIVSEESDTVITKSTLTSDFLTASGVPSVDVTEKYVVQDGKIITHITSLSASALNKLQEALAVGNIHETIASNPGELRISETKDLNGKWLTFLADEPGYITFNSDGSYQLGDMVGGIGDKGEYWFENQVLMMKTKSPQLYCDNGNASYVVFRSSSSTPPHQLNFS